MVPASDAKNFRLCFDSSITIADKTHYMRQSERRSAARCTVYALLSVTASTFEKLQSRQLCDMGDRDREMKC